MPVKKISLLVKKPKYSTPTSNKKDEDIECSEINITLLDEDKSVSIPAMETDNLDRELNNESSGTTINVELLPDDTNDTNVTEDTDTNKEQYIGLSPEQKEELIDKLETRKHKLKKSYKMAIAQNLDAQHIKEQLKETVRLLSAVKECDAIDKLNKNIQEANNLDKHIKKNTKKLAISDFNKIIDLTAPKSERDPDISTEQIWNRSKTVIFKNKTYRPAPAHKLEKFQNKMKLKSMPKHLKKDLQRRTNNNTNAINMYGDKVNTQYKEYDPLTHNGINQ